MTVMTKYIYDSILSFKAQFDMCAYCQLSTSGEHQLGCPLFGRPVPLIIYDTILVSSTFSNFRASGRAGQGKLTAQTTLTRLSRKRKRRQND